MRGKGQRGSGTGSDGEPDDATGHGGSAPQVAQEGAAEPSLSKPTVESGEAEAVGVAALPSVPSAGAPVVKKPKVVVSFGDED